MQMYKYMFLIVLPTMIFTSEKSFSHSSSSSSSSEEQKNKNMLKNNQDSVIYFVATLNQNGTIRFFSERIKEDQKTICEFFPLKNAKLVYDPSILTQENNASESSDKLIAMDLKKDA